MSASLALTNTHPRLWSVFWALAGVFVLHLLWSGRQKKRLIRLMARLTAEPGHFLIDAPCFLPGDRFSHNLDHTSRLLLLHFISPNQQDSRSLRVGLQKLIRHLKKSIRRYPADPGPPAFMGWSLALLSRLNGRAEPWESISSAAEQKLFSKALTFYAHAQALAPDDPSIAADWGRALEERAKAVVGELRADYLKMALEKYSKAVELDPYLAEGWRGQGRVLNLEALDSIPEVALELLTTAVSCYETARQCQCWDSDFYEEFGSLVHSLAGLQKGAKEQNYWHYASRLFVLAFEKNESEPRLIFKAGQALYQAGLACDEPVKAEEHYRQALEFLEEAAKLDERDPWSRLWAGRSLFQLAKLAEGAERLAILHQGAEFCGQSAVINPREEAIFSEWASILGVMAENEPSRAAEHWAEAALKYEAAINCPEVAPEVAAVNWHNWAYTLTCLAELEPSASIRRNLFIKAAQNYETAANLNNGHLVTLKNWGDVLGYQAELTDDQAQAQNLYEAAEEKYQRAIDLYPHKAGPWRRWSALWQQRARVEKTPGRRREMWQTALDKVERGAEAEPDDLDSWIMWGRLLGEMYREVPDYEHPLLVAGAIEKFEKALHLNPADDQVWNLMGRMRLSGADLPAEVAFGGGVLPTALAAVDNFKTACDLNPAQAGHWAEWGRSYFKVAQLLDNEASSLSALVEASDKYETAVALEPENSDHHTGLGHVLYQWGWRLEELEKKKEKFEKAYSHCGEAGRLAPHEPTVWRNWAKVAEALASLEKDPVISYDWQNEAEEKHYQADTLEGPPVRRH